MHVYEKTIFTFQVFWETDILLITHWLIISLIIAHFFIHLLELEALNTTLYNAVFQKKCGKAYFVFLICSPVDLWFQQFVEKTGDSIVSFCEI